MLEVASLSTVIDTRRGTVVAVDDVSIGVGRGEVLGLVGESGSGKSLLLLSILGLLAQPVRRESGSIRLAGRELTGLSQRDWRQVRGREISMIFQEPLTSLDPAFTIGKQMTETIRAHTRASQRTAETEAIEMLERVGIASASRRLPAYPHEFSGGMRQRVMIAMALVLRPKLLLADEPVTALDVTTQAQILDLIASLQRELEMAVILVSHDLGRRARHRGPRRGDVRRADRRDRRFGDDLCRAASSLYAWPPREQAQPGEQGPAASSSFRDASPRSPSAVAHCRFAPRCPRSLERCGVEMPGLEEIAAGRVLRCFNPRTGRRDDV